MAIPSLKRRNLFPDPRGKVFVFRQIRQAPMPQHRHEFWEIAIVIAGAGTHVTGRRRQRMATGDVFVINNRRAHGFQETCGLSLINILIRGDILPRVARDLRGLPGFHALFSDDSAAPFGAHVRLSAADLGQVEDWANRLEEETHRKAMGGYLLAEAYLTLIIGVLSRRRGARSPDEPESRASIGRVLSWIEKNLAHTIRVTDLARQAGMSERNFFRAFRDTMGSSPMAHLERARMHRAAELLRAGRSRSRIGEVAAACGYDDSNHFSRVFRRAHGVPPRDFPR